MINDNIFVYPSQGIIDPLTDTLRDGARNICENAAQWMENADNAEVF